MDQYHDYSIFDDDYLLTALDEAKATAVYWQGKIGRIEQEIARRLDERDATVLPSEKYIFEWPVRYEYPPGGFTPLKEVLTEAEMAECYIPEHKVVIPEHAETVPESWKTHKVLSIAKKRGPEVMGIIERNRVPKRSKPKFERRES